MVDGIKYASVKMSSLSNLQYKDSEDTYVCYVFPAKSESDVLVIDENLTQMFNVESTYSGSMLQILGDAVRNYDFGDIDKVDEYSAKIYANKKRICYEDTAFYRIEKILNGEVESKGRKVLEEPPREWLEKMK